MKVDTSSRILHRLALSSLAAGLLGMAQAATTLTWDTSPGTVGAGDSAITGGTGAWDTTNGNWTSDGGANNVAWVNANNDLAVFGGTAGTVTLGTTITANALTFNDNAGYVIAGSTLTLGGTTPALTANVDATISSILAGSAGVTKSGTGLLTLTGVNTYTGTTTINAGTLRLGNGTLNPTVNSTAYVINSAGTLKLDYNSGGSAAQTWSKFTGAGTLTLNSGKNFDYGWGSISFGTGFTGTVRVERGRINSLAATANNYGLGNMTKMIIRPGGHFGMWEAITAPGGLSFEIEGTGYGETGYEAAIRMGNGSTTSTINGPVNLTGNTTLGAAGTGVITQGIGETAVSNLTTGTSSMGGTIELRGANTYTGTTTVQYGTLLIGSSAGTSSASIYGGTITNQLTIVSGKTIRFASTGVPHTINGTVGGTGNIQVSGTSAAAATLNVVTGASMSLGQLVVGESAIGNYVQTDGTVTLSDTGNLWMANNAGGNSSTASVTGGTLNCGTGSSYLGVRGSVLLTVGGTADVTIGGLNFGHSGGTNNNPTGRFVTLGGTGLLKVASVTHNFVGSGVAGFNFDGGTLRATAAFTAPSSLTTTVKAGGAKFDTNTFNVTVGSSMLHDSGLGATPDGGVTKLGAGALTLSATAETYTGPTVVQGGTLTIPEISSTNLISVADGCTLGVVGGTGATIGGVSPITSLTLGATPGAGTATLNLGNFTSNPGAPLIYATDLVTNGAAGGITVNLPNASFTGTGTFPLVWYDNASISGDGFGAFILGALPRGVTASLADNPQELDIDVTGYNPLVWDGTVAGGVWDINTTANWQGIDTKYQEGDVVVFDTTATGTNSVVLNTTVAPSSLVIDNSTVSITGTGTIAGAVSILKNGASTATIGTNNTFTGLTAVNAGTLKVAHANALGSTGVGTSVANGATLDLNGTALAAEPLTLNGLGVGGNGALVNNSGTAASTASAITLASAASIGGTGSLTLSGTTTAGANAVTVGGTGNQTFPADIIGTAGLTKVGSGIATFSTRKSYTGNTVVNGGILDLTGGGGAGGTIQGSATVNTGGTLRITTGDATGYDTSQPRLTAINLNGGTMFVSTTSNQTLGAAVITMTGGTLGGVAGSNLDFFNTGSALTTLASATPSVVSGLQLRLRQNNGLTFTIADGAAPIDLDVQSGIAYATGFTNNDLIKNGSGTMRISGYSTYATNTYVNAGTLIVPAVQSSPNFTVADGATLGVIGTPGTSFSVTSLALGSGGGVIFSVANFGSKTTVAEAPVKVSTTLTTAAAVTLNLSGYFSGTGTFPVISYPASYVSGATPFTLVLPANVVGTLVDNPTNKTIDLVVTAVNTLIWDGTVAGGVWDTNNTANWIPNVSAPDGKYQEGMQVMLDDTASGTTAIQINTDVAPGYLAVNNTTQNYSVTGSAGITGPTPLVKSGTGTLTLANPNTYTGGTTISAGTLQLGDGTTNGTIAGNIVNNASLVFNNPTAVTLAGLVSGTGYVNKLGAGKISLTTAPTYTGATTISAGTLDVPSLIATSSITNNSVLSFTRSDATNTNVAGVITGTGSVTYNGPSVATSTLGQFYIDDVNTYTGTTTITNARAHVVDSSALGTGSITVNDGGQIYVARAYGPMVTISNPITISGLGWPEGAGILGAIRLNSGTIVSGPITMAANSRIGVYGDTGVISGVISGNYDLSLTANGNSNTLVMNGTSSNTYTGTTTLSNIQVVLSKIGAVAIPGNIVMDNTTSPQIWVTSSNQVPGNTLLSFTGNSGNARFDLMGTSQTFRGVVNNSTAATAVIQNSEAIGTAPNNSPLNYDTGTLVVNVPSGEDYSYLNAYLRSQNGILQVVKNGLGRQTFGGGTAIDYNGATAINAGELRFYDMDDVSSRSITVASGATLRIEALTTTGRDFNGNVYGGATWTGNGQVIMTGAGIKQFNGNATTFVKFGGSALVDVQQGTLRLGYGGSCITLDNLADLNIASGATFNTWDAPVGNEVRFDALTGAGTLTRGYTINTNSTGIGTFVMGVNNGSGTFNGVIADQVGNVGSIQNIVKRGTGTQTLAGVNTYHGSTLIETGTLALGAAGSINNSTAVTVRSGALFDVSATSGYTAGSGVTLTAGRTSGSGNDVLGSVTLNSGTLNVAGSSTAGTLTVSGDVTLNGGTVVLDASGNALGSGNDKLVAGNALNLLAPTAVAPIFNGPPDTTNPYTIMTGTAGIVGDAATLLTNGLTSSRYTLAFDSTTSPGNVLMTVSGTGESLVWSGAAAAEWKADVTLLNWTTGTKYFQNLDAVTFDDTNANGTVTINTTVSPAAITVGTAGAGVRAYTFSGTGAIAGGGTLTKTGTTTLTISNANTFSGGVVLSQGAVTLTNVNAAGTGTITLGDAGTGANNLTLTANVGSGTFLNPITVTNNGTGTVTISQPTNLSSLAGTLTLNRSATINSPGSDRVAVAGKITGNLGVGGTLTFTGLRTTLDNNTNDFVGDVAVATGATLQINAMNGAIPDASSVTVTGTVKLNTTSTNETIGGLNGTGTMQNHESVSGTPTLTVGYGDASGNFTGALNNGSGVLSLIKIGSGTQILGGAGNMVGSTRVLGGTLTLGNASALAASSLVYDNEGGTVDLGTLTSLNLGGLRGAQTLTIPSTVTALTIGHGSNGDTNVYTGTITMAGTGATFTKQGVGNQTLGGATSNSWAGNTNIISTGANGTTQGTLYLAKTGGAVAIPGNTTVNLGTGTNTGQANIRTLYDNQFGPNVILNFGNNTSGYCRFDLMGTTQTLAALTGTLGGAVVQNSGLGRFTYEAADAATVVLTGTGTYSYNGILRDTDDGANPLRRLNIRKTGTGTQTFSQVAGAGAFTGSTSVEAGSLIINRSDATNDFYSGTSYAVSAGALLEFNMTAAAGTGPRLSTMTGDITGNGTVRKSGTATMWVANNGSSTQIFANLGASGLIEVKGGQLRSISTRATNLADIQIDGGALLNVNGAGGSAVTSYFDALNGGSTSSNATFELDASRTVVLGVNGDGGTFYGNLTGGGNLTKNGAATLTLTGALSSGVPTVASSLSGNITVNGGKLVGAAVSSGSNSVFGSRTNTRTITVNTGATVEFQAPNTFGGHNTTSVPTLVVNGGTVTNADPLATNVINNGLRNVVLNNGTLASTVGNGTSTIDPVNRPGEGYGCWGLNGTVTSTGTSFITTTATGMAGRILLGSQGGDTTFDVTGTLTEAVPLQTGESGTPGGLLKIGSGKLILSATNIHSTATTINAGTLELSGSMVKPSALINASAITVGAAGTLMGNGTAEGTLTANGTVAPGASIGTLSTGAATFGATGILSAEIDSTALTADKLAVTGSVTITDGAKLIVTDTNPGTPTTAKLVLMTYTTTLTGTFRDSLGNVINDDSTIMIGANTWTVNYNDTDSGLNAVTLSIGSADPYDAWATSYGLTGPDALKSADPDGDGFNNLLEFATASDPTSGASGPRVYSIMHTFGADNALTLTMAVRKDAVFAAAANPNQKKQTATQDLVNYTVEATDDLVTWTTVEVTEVTGTDATNVQTALGAQLTVPALPADWEWHTFRTDGGAASDPDDMIRLRVTEVTP